MISKQQKFIEDNDIGLTNQDVNINMFLGDDEEEEVVEPVEPDDDEIDVNIGVVEEKQPSDYVQSDST